MSIAKTLFGLTADGREVFRYTIKNKRGASVSVLNLGGIIQSLMVPAADGTLTDVVLGYDGVADYERHTCYFGALIGRFGNRIGGSRFTLNGKEYALFANDQNGNHLHGGKEGFDKKLWAVEEGGDSLTLRYLSVDGEEGYPGNLSVTVTYRFSDGNELTIDYQAACDADTVLNLTNHAYFNLSGAGSGSVEDQELMLCAESYTAIDQYGLTVEQVVPVEKTPFDFREMKPIGRDIAADDEQLRFGLGYDHNFVLNPRQTMKRAAAARSAKTGILMEALTTQPGVQLYTGNVIPPHAGKDGRQYDARHGFCLETQHFPNSMACASFASPVLKKGEGYHEITAYCFKTI